MQFEPIDGLNTPRTGLLWQRFRDELPNIEEHPPLSPVVERFEHPEPSKVNVIVETKPPVPRVWFLDADKTSLIQVQPDRFIHNWRKVTGKEAYPRYETIRQQFSTEVAEFIAFLEAEKLGGVVVTQCEVTYVNHIEPEGVWERHGQVAALLRHWTDLPEGGFLPESEDVRMQIRHVIRNESGNPVGRLLTVLQPVWKTKDNSPVLTLNLTARGGPLSDGIDGAFRFFDLGRDWIVRGFETLTTDVMHQKWGKVQ